MTKSIRTARCRVQRIRQRQSIGTLHDHIVNPRTLTAYSRAARSFFTYCRLSGDCMPRTAWAVDAALCEFTEKAWEEGDSKSLPANARSALMHFLPRLRGSLHGSQRLLQAWTKHEMPERAPPLPTRFAMALAGRALAKRDVRLCVALMVAFHCFLRTGEILKMRAAHFVLPQRQGPALLSLPETKSGQRLQAVPESIVISDPLLLTYLQVLLPQLQSGEAIYPGGDRVFRASFAQLCREVRLPGVGWRPYSLRRGGATAHFLQFGSLDRTAVRGRWQSTRTARVYINEAVASLAAISASPAQDRSVEFYRRLVCRPSQLSR
jgi:hypothetical protein